MAYPAKLRVENVEIFTGAAGNDVTAFVPEMRFSGFASLINIGRETITKIEWAYCSRDYWWGKNLPMHRDFMARQQHCTQSWFKETGEPGAPGSVMRLDFDGVVPKDYDGKNVFFYFIGVINYDDPISKHLFVKFARRYDQSAGHFVGVDNPDYENEYDK